MPKDGIISNLCHKVWSILILNGLEKKTGNILFLLPGCHFARHLHLFRKSKAIKNVRVRSFPPISIFENRLNLSIFFFYFIIVFIFKIDPIFPSMYFLIPEVPLPHLAISSECIIVSYDFSFPD